MKKLLLTTLMILLVSTELFAHSKTNGYIKTGVGLGSIIAVVVSWERNKSVLFSVIHGIFGWLYVLYFVLTRKPEE